MKCKNCGTQNSAQALKCSNCNAPLDGSMVAARTSDPLHSGNVTCKNCNATNAADALKCHQCNAPLDGSMVVDHSNRASLGDSQVMCKNCKATNPANALKCHQCNAPLDGSLVIRNSSPVKEAKIDKSTTAIHQQLGQDTNKCPGCGYPNQPMAENCVKCDTPLKAQSAPVVKQVESTVIAVRDNTSAPVKTRKAMDLTINPYAEQAAKPAKSFLTPLHSDLSAEKGPITLDQKSNHLTREQLDPSNTTITSSGQAVISFDNGAWTIEDTSAMQTTFIKVSGKVTLNEGDIILMGNKMFKFSAE
ncbi:MAG: zinc ribbon domain-containing protein [Saprospiraceae bacterium]|uniref:double zinc ribbon domain-containing protein n=1 Tax=Candidatus Brachybacter algidus TaxID=2982024 RepID=UPI00257D8F56|nr:zinc ribbon domain-containing protein [Candidatus Brachybacter algidus]MBK7603437.1 zinc ribbon domain-containing protein [Candidatus Brachybacter algidus]